LSKKIKKI